MAQDLQALKRQFLEYLEIEKGRSVKTIENYDRYLTRFLTQTKISSPAKLTEPAVREFRIWLNRQPGVTGSMKRKTQNYYMIALRAFLKFLRKNEIESLSPEKIELAKVGGRDLDLTRDELSIRGKGEKVRVVFLSDGAKRAVADYLKQRKDMSDALFVSYGRGGTGGKAGG